MDTKFLLSPLIILLLILSCKKEKDPSESIPKFEGLTIQQSGVDFYSIDTTDWRTDDRFSELEQSLFDTLKFDNVLNQKVLLEDLVTIAIEDREGVLFFPNPVINVGYFEMSGPSIMNCVIVDQSFRKKTEFRFQSRIVAINFSSFDEGIYRMYYVLQDEDFNIVGLGHGDIQVRGDMY